MTTGEYILITVLSLLMVADLVGNTLVCVVVLRNRYLYLRHLAMYMCVGVIGVPIPSTTLWGWFSFITVRSTLHQIKLTTYV